MAKGRSVIRILLYLLNLLAATGLIASYLADYIPPDRFWILAFFGISYPFWLILNLLFVIIWLLSWRRMIFLSLITILIGYQHLLAIYPIRFSDPSPSGSSGIRILSFNIHTLYGNSKLSPRPENKGKVTEFLAKRHADIYCLQEFYAIGEDFSKTLSKFANTIHLDHYAFVNYQEFANKKKINAIATFSRYPVIRSYPFRLPGGLHFALASDLVIQGDTVRLYNLHLASIHFGREDYSFYSDLTDRDNENKTPIQEGSKRMLWKLRKAFIQRSRQVKLLAADIRSCPYPVILAGDFNDTPSSYTYHQLTSQLNDAFLKSGKGLFGSTYTGQLPSFRIDYILYSKQFRSQGYETIVVDLSDHYPITVTLFKQP